MKVNGKPVEVTKVKSPFCIHFTGGDGEGEIGGHGGGGDGHREGGDGNGGR